MRLSEIKHPSDFIRLVAYRKIRPRWWRYVVAPFLQSLSEEGFARLVGRQGLVYDDIAELHEKVRFRFFIHPRNQKDFFLQLLTTTQPYESILEEGNHVLENKFQTLGSPLVDLGDSINWHRDFKSGKEWPLKPFNELDILDLDNPSDVKVPWELSRFHQVWWLGKAYWLTRNERYAEKFASLVSDWIGKNPVGYGVNWAIAMEAAIRASNWIAGYYFFCESKSIPASFWIRFFKSLYEHGVYIEHHVEYSWRNGNHFLSNVVGMIVLGIFFRHTSFGQRWLDWGVQNLPREMEYEVEPDGVNYEKSTSYHRLVLEFFYTAAILCRINKIQLPRSFWERLEKMMEYVEAYTRSDGSIPLVGDADDGRLFRFRLKDNINDHRHALSVGALLFERGDFKQAAGGFSQDTLFLLGTEGFERYQKIETSPAVPTSVAFPHGGFYVMRSRDAHVFIDAGDIGMRGRGGHGHNDVLSFEYWHAGNAIIVDSGTYSYTFDTKARQEFRGTRAHNTVMVDRHEQAKLSSLWEIVEDRTRPEVIDWHATEQSDNLTARHHGYDSIRGTHTRRFSLDKSKGILTIQDTIGCRREQRIESYLHFAPDFQLSPASERKVMATNGTAQYIVCNNVAAWSIQESWFSPSYGMRVRNSVLVLQINSTIPISVTMEIIPIANESS